MITKTCKIRCYLNSTQTKQAEDVIYKCHSVQNLYIASSIKYYKETGEFLSGYSFARIFTKLKKNDEYFYYQGVSTKALKDSIMNAEAGIKQRLSEGKPPQFRSRKKNPVTSFFFIKDNIHFDIVKKNKIKIPILGEIRIRERDYLPDEATITSGRVIKENNKYFVMFIYTTEEDDHGLLLPGIGIDLGIKKYATIACTELDKISQEESFLKFPKYKEIEKKIDRINKVISHKVEINYSRKLMRYMDKHNGEEPNENTKNIMKGESYNTSSVQKCIYKLRRLYKKRSNMVKNFIKKLVHKLTRTKLVWPDGGIEIRKPEYICIEKLDIRKMLEKNGQGSDLRDLIQKSMWYYFTAFLIQKCHEFCIELRGAEKFFASSKTCSYCGHKLKTLTLKDRTFHCPKCGAIVDRDINSAINLCNLKDYVIL